MKPYIIECNECQRLFSSLDKNENQVCECKKGLLKRRLTDNEIKQKEFLNERFKDRKPPDNPYELWIMQQNDEED